MIRTLRGLFVLFGLIPVFGNGQTSSPGERPIHGAWALKQYEVAGARHKDNPDILVLPGLVADRKKQQVDLLAETTGLAEKTPVEYLLVYQASSHGYEALLWAFAKPGDVRRALEFIGLPAGAPVDPSQLRFHAKGERVTATVLPAEDEGTAIRLEQAIFDLRTDRTMEAGEFLFTGSMKIEEPGGVLADRDDPFSIIASYNERASVLEVPWPMSKSEAYQAYVVHPDEVWPANRRRTVRLEPLHRDGHQRVRDLVLDVGGPRPFRLRDAKSGQPLNETPTMEGAVKAGRRLQAANHDLFVSIQFDLDLKLAQIWRLAPVLGMVAEASDMRLEPPVAGRLYYGAFLKRGRWRDPRGRPGDVWELHLAEEEQPSGTMVFQERVFKAGAREPTFRKTTEEVADGDAVRRILETHAEERRKAKKLPAPRALLVFAPAKMSYRTLLPFVRPILKTHKTIYVMPVDDPSRP
ncbi:MAG: YdjY domain-containing protein [Verrucomicrobiota bacterium]